MIYEGLMTSTKDQISKTHRFYTKLSKVLKEIAYPFIKLLNHLRAEWEHNKNEVLDVA